MSILPSAKEDEVSRGQKMKAIEEAIAQWEAKRAEYNLRVDGTIAGLKQALSLQEGGSGVVADEVPQRKRARRGDLKETVLAIAEHVGDKGLTSDECIKLAKQLKGVTLIQGSVSSLLSRLKQDGVLFFDGARYRLQQFSGPRKAA